MPGTAGPNLGMVTGYAPRENGWGLGAFTPNFDMLDAIVMLGVISSALTTPPGSPSAGDRYIVGVGATGAWAGHDKAVAVYRNSVWNFYTPKKDWRAYDENAAGYTRFNGTSWAAESSASSSGLYGPAMSLSVPTIANTGLSTWLNQNSASFVDGATGCCLKQVTNTGSFSVNARLKAAPSTPYTLTGLFATNSPAPTSSNYAGFIWYDGTNKCHLFGINSGSILIGKANTPTSYSANDSITSGGFSHQVPIWLQIEDDGTNVYFRYSTDGENWITLQTTAKSSAWLGATGYTNVGIFVDAQNSQTMTTLMSLAQT